MINFSLVLYLSIMLPAAAELDCKFIVHRYMSKMQVLFYIASPVSVSALIGEKAVFFCNGSGVIIQWTVDGVYATHTNITGRGITFITLHTETMYWSTVQSTLTVPTLVNNGTTVQCVIYPGEVTSDKATLTVLRGEFVRIT